MNSKGQTVLMIAAEKGFHNCVSVLVNAGADVNIQDWLGNNALIKAADEGTYKCVQILLHSGADVNTQNNLGITALMKRTKKDCRENVE